MVEYLSEEAIRRGYLTREWLERFLRAARYPMSGQLIKRLFPTQSQAAPARVYQNLPAPTYNRYGMRAQAFADVVEGLHQRSADAYTIALDLFKRLGMRQETQKVRTNLSSLEDALITEVGLPQLP
jgi:hypothetical protein